MADISLWALAAFDYLAESEITSGVAAIESTRRAGFNLVKPFEHDLLLETNESLYSSQASQVEAAHPPLCINIVFLFWKGAEFCGGDR